MADSVGNTIPKQSGRTPPAEDPESAFGTRQTALHLPRLSTPDQDPPGAEKLGLTSAEIEQFRDQGYVIKRGLIPQQEFSPLIDLWWQQPPIVQAGMSPDAPDTWVAPAEHWPEENRWGLAENW